MLSPDTFISKIKPACDKFIKSATKENLNLLNNEMENVDDNTLNRFQSYLLIPLLMKMDNLDVRDEELKSQLVDTLNGVIKRIKIKDKAAIKTILVVLMKQIHDFQSGLVNHQLSEELKTALIQCISSTLQKSTCDSLDSFYTKENAGFVGKIAVTCVELISKEKYRKLRIAGIECLMSVFYVHDVADFTDIVIRNSVADIIFVFLPKIVQTLISVATGDEKQGRKLIATSIKALGRILCLIFEDYHREQSMSNVETKDFIALVENATKSNKSDDEILGMNLKSRPIEERMQTLLNMERNNAWLSASCRKLVPILKTMTKLRANPSSEVRKEYAIMCCTLIEKCYKHFSENLSVCVETVFALTQDDELEIRHICMDLVRKMNEIQSLSSFLTSNITNLFEAHLISLPRIINRWEDSEQISEFLFLKGILENAGDECLSTVLCVPNNLEKFCNCLIAALELELNNALLREEYAIRDITGNLTETKPLAWRKFKKINNNKVLELIQSICEISGTSKMVDPIFDYFISVLMRDSSDCNEVILLLIMLLTGSRSHERNTNENIISSLEEILQDRRWNLALQANQMKRINIENDSNWFVDRTPGLYESAIEIRTQDISLDDDDDDADDNTAINIADTQFNILHTCLLLDAIGHFALVLEHQFAPFMYKTLHRVLQKASSSNYIVHEAAMFALTSIQKGFKLESIPDLIREYSNYISYHVNVGLKRMNDDKSAFDILSTVLQFSSFDSISYLENIITTILEEASRFEQTTNIESYLKVFHMFLLSVGKWTSEWETNEKSEETLQETEQDVELFDKWMEILNRNKNINDNLNSDMKDINRESQETPTNTEIANELEQQEETPSKKALPRHIDIVINILKEVLKFVASKNQMHKIISLECIISGLPLLKDFEDELLPIVHLVWHPFSQRFKEKDAIVLNRCFTLLEVLAIHAKDFLLQRTLADIFPLLCDFLRRSSKNSIGKTYLVQTQEFKLQCKLIKEYPTLIECMEVHEREFDRISEVVLLYLNRKQPKLLRESAVEYFHRMSAYNCPAVYIKLISYLADNDMKDNVSEIIDFINRR